MLVIAAASPTLAVTLEWAVPVDERFEGAFNWSPVGVPDADDIAQFTVSPSPSYTVLIGSNPTIDKLIVDGGTPALAGTSGLRTLTITDDGGLQVGAEGEMEVVGVNGDRSLVFANGPVTIDCGTLTVGDFGEFTLLGDDHTLVASNNAQVDFGFNQAIHSGRTYTIESGADVTVSNLIVGGASTGDGTLNVDGDGSTLTVTSATNIAQSGETGRVAFTNGAVGSFRSVGIAESLFNNVDGLWTLFGGSQATTDSIDIATQGVDVVGRLMISGAGTRLEQRPGANLEIGSDTTGSGTVTVEMGATLVTGTPTFPTNGITTINATGTLRLQGGTLVAATIDHTHGGEFDFDSGSLSVVTFDGDLVNEGGTLAPGASAGSTTILGDYTQQTGATLQIEIGGTAAVAEHDFVSISGDVLLGGFLELAVIDGFEPGSADTFTVLSAGSLTGFFDNATPGARVDTVDGLGSFLVDIDFAADQIVLSSFSFAADFDQDGDVDGDDLAQWEGDFGGPGSDADGDGDSDGKDFLTWQQQFGSGISSPAASQAVPEPTAIALLLTLLPAAKLWRRVSDNIPIA